LDYYRNLGEGDFQDLPLGDVFSEYRFWYLPTHFDLFFAGVRAGDTDQLRATIPDDAAVIALRTLMSRPYRAVMAPFRGLSGVLSESRYQTAALRLWKALGPVIGPMDRRHLGAGK
jgi:hypothetical protein